MKKLIFTLCISFFISISLAYSMQKTENALSSGVIRLHVRANSDTDADQSLKLKVRDRIIDECSYLFKNNKKIENARDEILKNSDKIEKIARDEILKNGYNYPVKINFGKSDFPVKVYKNITLPAGTYEALTVEIGNAEGQNWWCVLFPPLCFVDETCTGISKESESILIDNLGKETYEMLKNDDESDIKIRFKIYEVWENGKKKIETLMRK